MGEIIECKKSLEYLKSSLDNISASLSFCKILVASYSLPCIYLYNENTCTYREELQLQPNSFKYIFENWVLAQDNKLYEITKSSGTRNYFLHPNTIWKGSSLLLSGFFKRKAYIYFITSNQELMRINKKQKKIELVKFVSK